MKKYLKKIFRLLPTVVQNIFIQIIYIIKCCRQRLKANLMKSDRTVDISRLDKLYWINPQKITYMTLKEFNIYGFKGKVVGGGWDKLEKKFEDLDFHSSFKERALKGTAWENLPYYKNRLEVIGNGRVRWGPKTKVALDARCNRDDYIFSQIEKDGYKNMDILKAEDVRKQSILLQKDDDITINIGRYGDLLFNNGRHRLSFVKILDIKRIPVKITVRHAEWDLFRREIETYAQKHGGKIYAPLTHIDLQDISSFYTSERFDIIKKNMSLDKGTLLDIGAHWGYFCHKFEEESFFCTAVEQSEEHLYFLRKLKRAERRKFKIIPKSVFALTSKRKIVNYDVILALSIFHHFLKSETKFQKLKYFLGCLKAKELFVEPHLSEEPQMQGAFKNFKPREFVKFILKHSCFNKYALIAECEDSKRQLYKLWK